jgi:hypothetical protein
LKAEGLRPTKLAVASPNTNAFVERFVQTIKQECLDHFVVVGKTHLDYIVAEFLRYYHNLRPHQGVGNVTLDRATANNPPTETVVSNTAGDVVRDEWLGGLLKSYRARRRRGVHRTSLLGARRMLVSEDPGHRKLATRQSAPESQRKNGTRSRRKAVVTTDVGPAKFLDTRWTLMPELIQSSSSLGWPDPVGG